MKKPRIVASIEARCGSSRLPRKVLADVLGVPALARLIRRLKHCRTLDGVVVATTTDPGDDELEALARAEGIACHRGSVDDVLARVVGAHRQLGSDLIVEVTGDCTMLDPEVIDWGVEHFLANDAQVVANVRVPSFPEGQDIQVFPRALLEQVEATVHDPAVREHVSLHFYEHPERYRIIHLLAPPAWRRAKLRCQLDWPEDLAFIRAVHQALEPIHGPMFGLAHLLELLDREPAIAALNAHRVEKPVRPEDPACASP